MATDDAFSRYVALIDVTEQNAQNVQELAAIWGDIDNELADIGVTVDASYAALGDIDFVVVYQAPSPDVAFQTSVILERHGLDVQTMPITSTEHFSDLVGDL